MDKLIAPDAVLEVLYEVRCVDDEGGRMARDVYLSYLCCHSVFFCRSLTHYSTLPTLLLFALSFFSLPRRLY